MRPYEKRCSGGATLHRLGRSIGTIICAVLILSLLGGPFSPSVARLLASAPDCSDPATGLASPMTHHAGTPRPTPVSTHGSGCAIAGCLLAVPAASLPAPLPGGDLQLIRYVLFGRSHPGVAVLPEYRPPISKSAIRLATLSIGRNVAIWLFE